MPPPSKKNLETNTIQETHTLCQEIRKSQEYLSQRFDDLENAIKTVAKEHKELKTEISYLNNKVHNIEREYQLMHYDVYKNYFTISGLPVHENEDLKAIIKDITSLLNVKLNSMDIKSYRRLRTKTNTAAPIILVELSTHEIIEQLQNNYKQNGPLILNQIQHFKNDKNNTSKIFINEFVDNKTKHIIIEANKLKKKLNIKFVWHKYGTVKLRCTDNSRIYNVRSITDLAKVEQQIVDQQV